MALLACTTLVAQAGGVYRWTDEKGQVHFGDRPQASDKAEVVAIESRSGWQPLNIEVIPEGRLARKNALDDAGKPLPTLDIDRIQHDVNRVYHFFDQILYFDFYRQVPVKIHVFENRTLYNRYLAQRTNADLPETLGIFLSRDNEIAVYLHPEKLGGLDSTYATIRHEASHAILFSLSQRVPDWLNEGLAEQMETLDEHKGGFQIGRHDGNRKAVLYYREQMPPVLEFVEVRNGQWRHGNRKGLNQVMAGQLVFMLLSTRYGRDCVTRLLQDYKRGINKRSFYLLDQHYIGGAAALRLHWNQWLATDMAQPAVVTLE